MKNSTSLEDLIPLSDAATRFGYRDAKHFRRIVAPRNGIQPIRQGSRWFVPRRALELALATLTQEVATTTP